MTQQKLQVKKPIKETSFTRAFSMKVDISPSTASILKRPKRMQNLSKIGRLKTGFLLFATSMDLLNTIQNTKKLFLGLKKRILRPHSTLGIKIRVFQLKRLFISHTSSRRSFSCKSSTKSMPRRLNLVSLMFSRVFSTTCFLFGSLSLPF